MVGSFPSVVEKSWQNRMPYVKFTILDTIFLLIDIVKKFSWYFYEFSQIPPPPWKNVFVTFLLKINVCTDSDWPLTASTPFCFLEKICRKFWKNFLWNIPENSPKIKSIYFQTKIFWSPNFYFNKFKNVFRCHGKTLIIYCFVEEKYPYSFGEASHISFLEVSFFFFFFEARIFAGNACKEW